MSTCSSLATKKMNERETNEAGAAARGTSDNGPFCIVLLEYIAFDHRIAFDHQRIASWVDQTACDRHKIASWEDHDVGGHHTVCEEGKGHVYVEKVVHLGLVNTRLCMHFVTCDFALNKNKTLLLSVCWILLGLY